MKYLVIGASGFIGRAIVEYCRSNGLQAVGTGCRNAEKNGLMIFDQTKENLKSLLDRCRIEDYEDLAVILCAANAGIDSCRRNEEASRLLNVLSTEAMIDEIAELGAKPIFLSSEAVFDGKRGLYAETEAPCPVSLYGRQKVLVEEYIRSASDRQLTFRISRAVSSYPGRDDIFDAFHEQITHGQEIVCIRGQSFNPTDVEDIAKCIVEACEAGLTGLYHAANGDYVTRSELAELYARRVLGMNAHVTEKDHDEFGFLDSRPVKAGLAGGRLERDLKITMRSLNDILASLKDAEESKNAIHGERV